MADRTVRVAIIGDSVVLKGALRDAEGALTGFQRRMRNIGTTMATTGRRMTTALTLPIVAVGALSVKAAIDFETAFAGVRKTVDATEREFAVLERGIRDMATELPASAVEIAGVAEAAGQLGVAQDDILSFTRVMIDLGETTNLEATEAATAIARFANVTGTSMTDVDRLGSVIVELGNNMATTESEIVTFGQRLSVAGTELGLTEADILAFGAALSSVGINAEAGGTAVSKVFRAINVAAAEGGESLQTFADVAGMTADEFASMVESDPSEAVFGFVDGLNELNPAEKAEAMDKLGIANERTLAAMGALAGGSDELRDALDMSEQSWIDNTSLTDEARERYGTLASKLEVVRDKFIEAAIVIGEKLMPALEDLAEFVGDAAESFGELTDTQVNMVIWGAAVVAAIGPLLWIFGKLAIVIGAIGAPVAIIGAALILFAIGAVIAYQKLEPFRDLVDEMVDSFGELGDALDELTAALGLPDLDISAIEIVKAAFAPMVVNIMAVTIALTGAAKFLTKFFEVLTIGVEGAKLTWQGLRDIVATIIPYFQRATDKLREFAGIVLAPVIAGLNAIKGAAQSVRDAVQWAIDKLRELANLSGFGGVISGLGGIAGAASNAAGAAGRLLANLQAASQTKVAVPSSMKKNYDFTGGISSGGPTIVGESGPELVFMPKGSRVRTASRSKPTATAAPSVTPDDIRMALSGMRFEMGDGFIQLVARGLRDNDRAVA